VEWPHPLPNRPAASSVKNVISSLAERVGCCWPFKTDSDPLIP
jgi:hypothetical protein